MSMGLKILQDRNGLYTYFGEGVRLDLREFVLHVVGVHGLDLLPRGSTKNLYDLYELINSALSGEEGLAQHQFGHDATC